MARRIQAKRLGNAWAALLAATALTVHFLAQPCCHSHKASVLQHGVMMANKRNAALTIDSIAEFTVLELNRTSAAIEMSREFADRDLASYAACVSVFVLTVLVAQLEAVVPQPRPVPFEARSDIEEVLFVNVLLSLTAGMLNALAFLEMPATMVQKSVNGTHGFQSWGIDFACLCCYLSAFLLGGALVCLVKADCEGVFVGRFSASMLGAAFATVGGTAMRIMGGAELAALALWGFALGVQEGLCRKFSSMPLSSMDFVGQLTDAGRLFGTWVRSKVVGGASPNMTKLPLFIASVLSFVAGGFAAQFGRNIHGVVIGFVPAFSMALIGSGIFRAAVDMVFVAVGISSAGVQGPIYLACLYALESVSRLLHNRVHQRATDVNSRGARRFGRHRKSSTRLRTIPE